MLLGGPFVGADLVFGVDNPLGTQAPGSLPLLLISLLPAPNHPCGLSVSGLGMAGGGVAGEWLVSVGEPPGFLGARFYVQGVVVDPTPGEDPTGALAGAMELVVGG